jgi:hypothetical protein
MHDGVETIDRHGNQGSETRQNSTHESRAKPRVCLLKPRAPQQEMLTMEMELVRNP